MNRSAKFWDKVADRYAKSPVKDEAAYEHKLEVTRRYFRPDMRVLEFGCGTGSTAILHAPHVNHIHAIDISSRMLEIARQKAEAEGIQNLTFAHATIDAVVAEPETYDAVMGLSILHLLEDKEAAIAKVHHMLKPGGVFVTSTVCLGDTMKFVKLIGPVGRFLGLMPLVKVFTTDELETSLTNAGFDIDYRWQPAKSKAAFIVAKKPE